MESRDAKVCEELGVMSLSETLIRLKLYYDLVIDDDVGVKVTNVGTVVVDLMALLRSVRNGRS